VARRNKEKETERISHCVSHAHTLEGCYTFSCYIVPSSYFLIWKHHVRQVYTEQQPPQCSPDYPEFLGLLWMTAVRCRTRGALEKKLFSVRLGDRSLLLCLGGETTVASLKEIIQAREGIPTFPQKLYKGNRLMQNWVNFGDGDETRQLKFNLQSALATWAEQTMDRSGQDDRRENINPAAGLPRREIREYLVSRKLIHSCVSLRRSRRLDI
jgi:hypothetical protein